MVTAGGSGYFQNYTQTVYNSGYVGDPNQLFVIGTNLYSMSIVDGGTTLELELEEPVPEPAAALLCLMPLPLLARRPRRRLVRVLV